MFDPWLFFELIAIPLVVLEVALLALYVTR